ncbi:MAG: glycerol kinase GlpK [Vampirovibrionales bacterium]|nr:glycerol kinase GlpK [Vampirovibrionales bacterium]
MPQTEPQQKQQYILVFDHGTTSIRACVMNHDGKIVAIGQSNFEQVYPRPGWVEHRPNELWQLTLTVAEEALEKASASWQDIAGIGITNQRETVILWDVETGEPVYNAIVWQCRRTADFCAQLKAAGHEQRVRDKTGLVLDPYFSATKIRWLLDNVPKARDLLKQGRLRFGTVDTWILWHLSGRQLHLSDYTNASRTLLYNIHDLCWDTWLLKLFGIPEEILPQVQPSRKIYGHSDPKLTGGVRIPLASDIGDQQAALYGQKCWQPGKAKSTYGTGAFLMMHTGNKAIVSNTGMLSTIAASDDGEVAYALEGAIFIAGGAIEWLQKQMKCFTHPGEMDAMVKALSKVEQASGDTQGESQRVYFIPAFTGLGAPHWNATARGSITGLTQDTGPAHLVRGALEAMAYQTREVLEAMVADAETAKLHLNLEHLRIDGGVTRSQFLCQFLSDMLQVPILRTDDAELTAKGAAYLAGLAVGFWQSPDEIARLSESTERFSPGTLLSEPLRKQYYLGWQQAVSGLLRAN